MKVLVISHLFNDVASGPSWSVPAYVDSLSVFDEVLWVNTTDDKMSHWGAVNCYHKLSEFGRLHLRNMPKAFRQPDIVIFQGFNFIEQPVFAFELRRKKIPYIIVPRGSLTHQAIHNHAKYKKWVAHKLLLDRYLKKAMSIQYLTKEEYVDSGDKWNSNSFILSNGYSNCVVKDSFSRDAIKGVFIGRLDMYHKGIDFLIDAVDAISEKMRASSFSISFYGPYKYDFEKIAETIEARNLSDILSVHGPVSGEEKKRVLLESDLFFLTSRFEGHPMGLIEALSYGLPAFVTPGSNMLSEIRDTNSGWTVNSTEVNLISSALLDVIENSNVFKEKGRNARELSLRYDWGQLAEELHKILIVLFQKGFHKNRNKCQRYQS